MDSELRQDLVSGDWILVAPKRRFRPHQFIKGNKRVKTALKGCPFENPQKSGNDNPILAYPKSKDNGLSLNWKIQIVENKYPAFTHRQDCARISREGPYSVSRGRGYQDLVITRDHFKNFPHLDSETTFLIFKAFQDRYRMLTQDSCLAYVSIFQNWGPSAGASIYHPHYQIMSIPVIPPDVGHSLSGSDRYFKKYRTCVHCQMLKWEKKTKKRIIFEDRDSIAIAPFVSRQPFEVRIFPQKHLAYFEDTKEEDLRSTAAILKKSLYAIEKKLKDPDYNFFIHTSPILNKAKYSHYHWHIEILPKMSIAAGFELGTGIDITVVDPDEAAKILRS